MRTASVLLLFALVAAHLVQGADPRRYNAYCNYICDKCEGPKHFDINACDLTQTGGGCNLPKCKPWSQGAFPTLVNGKPATNGGVPQAANLTYHLDLLKEQVVHHIPDEKYDGNAVFDFEDWTPVWEDNDGGGWWHSLDYQLYSIELVKKEHPDWPLANLTAEAKKQFVTAGAKFFAESLKAVKSLRPHAKWGFYGFPWGHYGLCLPANGSLACGYSNPLLGPDLREANDQIAEVWKESTALFPSIYLMPQDDVPTDLWTVIKQKYVSDTVNEAVRLADKYSGPNTVVLPFYWAYYHNGTTTITPQDVDLCIENAWNPPRSTGMVLWGGNENIASFLKDTEGPKFKKAVLEADQCAKQHCSGKGWCNWLNVTGTMPSNPTCMCDDGKQGSTCP